MHSNLLFYNKFTLQNDIFPLRLGKTLDPRSFGPFDDTETVAPMNKVASVFLQMVVVLIGVGALTFMLLEPHLEGRNANATTFEIYFKDPFLAYIYLGSLAFYLGLYQAFKVLGFAGQNMIICPAAVGALRSIKLCAIIIVGFVAVGLLIIMFSDSDDRAGGVAMSILIIFGSVVVASIAAVFERVLQNAVELKSENDLTV
jgi:Protein of unknown function (DUF2975)